MALYYNHMIQITQSIHFLLHLPYIAGSEILFLIQAFKSDQQYHKLPDEIFWPKRNAKRPTYHRGSSTGLPVVENLHSPFGN